MSSSILVPKLSPGSSEPCFVSGLNFLSCLGQGGFGIVLQGLHPITKISTAVKFIFPSGSTPKEEKQFLRECELAATLNHANIVTVINSTKTQFDQNQVEKVFQNLAEDDERSLSYRDLCIAKAKRHKSVESICIQMELCGQNLRKWLNLQHDKNEEAVQTLQLGICRGIVDGLAYLHGKQIIHRDLKPENIMFSKSGDFLLPVKIGDFGLCRLVHSNPEEVSTLTSRVGTEDYMAPEAFTKSYSFQADLFSLGLVIWEVVQLIPFRERKPLFAQLIYNQDEKSVKQFRNSRMRNMAKLIVQLTKKDKRERLQSIQVVVMMFANWGQGLEKESGVS